VGYRWWKNKEEIDNKVEEGKMIINCGYSLKIDNKHIYRNVQNIEINDELSNIEIRKQLLNHKPDERNWEVTGYCIKVDKDNWKVVDKYGNIECPVCGKPQSPNFGHYCIYCCPHDEVYIKNIIDDSGIPDVEFICKRCKRVFTDKLSILTRDYVLKKKNLME
jgi:hypothetical protein